MDKAVGSGTAKVILPPMAKAKPDPTPIATAGVAMTDPTPIATVGAAMTDPTPIATAGVADAELARGQAKMISLRPHLSTPEVNTTGADDSGTWQSIGSLARRLVARIEKSRG
jgi:hypothetical protein